MIPDEFTIRYDETANEWSVYVGGGKTVSGSLVPWSLQDALDFISDDYARNEQR